MLATGPLMDEGQRATQQTAMELAVQRQTLEVAAWEAEADEALCDSELAALSAATAS